MAIILHRRGTEAEWQAANPILEASEIGYVISGTNAGKFKIGDGTSTWNDLDYFYAPVIGTTSGTVAAGDHTHTEYLGKVNSSVTTADPSLNVVRNTTISTDSPSGGMDGDIWMVYS